MVAGLAYLAVVHDQNYVGILNSGKSVSYHNGGNVAKLGLNRLDSLLDLLFVDTVERRGGLVQQ